MNESDIDKYEYSLCYIYFGIVLNKFWPSEKSFCEEKEFLENYF